MRPFTQNERDIYIKRASDAFPDKDTDDIEKELDEYQGLLSESFKEQNGLSTTDEDRLKELAQQFQP